MYALAEKVYDRALGSGVELVCVNGGSFELNRVLFACDTALVADSGRCAD